METETAFIIPAGDPGLPALRLEMAEVFAAEQRIHEIAIVNAQKAPEMLAILNQAYLALVKMVARVEMEMVIAEGRVNARRSEVVLDIAPVVLKEKGLATSKDLRDAVVDRDVAYQELQTRFQTIVAYREWLRGKAKGMEMAYSSIKRIIDRPAQLGGSRTAGYTPADPQQSTPVGGTTRYVTTTKKPSGFGGADL